MDPVKFPFALLGFLGFVAIMPAWVHFSGQYVSGLPDYQSFILQLMMPVMVLLFVVSWIQPR